VELEEGADVGTAVELLAEDPEVAYAGPNHVFSVGVGEETVPWTPVSTDPAAYDTLVSRQWALTDARVLEAWERSRGEGILVGVIDTGVSLTHPDLAPQIAVNEAEQNGLPGFDDDGNGYVDDVFGYDFVDAPSLPGDGDWRERDPDPTDDMGHGTQVSGVVLAEEGSGKGIAGVAPDARLIAVRAGFRTRLPFQSGLLEEDDIAAAILYAVDRGARILNLSFGDGTDAPVLREAIRYAQDHGVLVVASAGNVPADRTAFPAATVGVLVAGASTSAGERAGFSAFGQDLDLLAPGLSLLTTQMTGGYVTSSGTSFSAPMVVGTAALVWSLHPDWTAEEVAWSIRLAARRSRQGWEPATGWGYLDAARAVAAEGRPPTVGVGAIAPVSTGESIALSGTVADPDLLAWTLSVVPESLAVGWGSEDPIPGETPLVASSARQRVDEVLAEFHPPPGSPRRWVSRLIARIRGGEPLEERSRFVVPTDALVAWNLVAEVRGGAAGWDVAVTWETPDLAQGAVRLGAGSPGLLQEEVNVSRFHGLVLNGPLPAGVWPLEVLGRGPEGGAYTLLRETSVVIPGEAVVLTRDSVESLPAGSPMRRTVDWDHDGLPEVLVEIPNPGTFYGEIHRLELDPAGGFTERGVSVFRGYPADAGDLDGDGLPEVVAFRLLEGWFAYESVKEDQFPRSLVHSETEGVPWQFVDTEGGPRLLTVDGSRLLSWRSDGNGGYAVAAEDSVPRGELRTRGAFGDFDGDGVEEAALVDQDGRLVRFDVEADAIRYRDTVTPPSPLAGPLVAIPVGRRADLLSVEQDPFKGETPVVAHATRIRRWSWTGTTLRPVEELGFTGAKAERDLDLLTAGGDRVFLRRDKQVDVVRTEAGGLGWGGSLGEASLEAIEGMTYLPGQSFLWFGSTLTSLDHGEGWRLADEAVPARSGRLEVVAASPLGNSVRVALRWAPSGCGSPVTLTRESSIRGSGMVQVEGDGALDTLALGEQITYTLTEAGCSARTLSLEGRLPTTWSPRWSPGDRIVVDLDRPLRQAPGGVFLVAAAGAYTPAAVEWDREGSRLVLPVGAGPEPDSLVIQEAWEEDGYPLGGAIRTASDLPPRSSATLPPVLASVRYEAAATGPRLHVELGGGELPDSCAVFTLDPGGATLTGAVRSGSELEVPLPGPLAMGRYTLRLLSTCNEGAGSERGFHVGAIFYPNPLRGGADLTLESLPPGSQVRIFDATGEERLSWQVTGTTQVVPVELPPGLYFLRFEGEGFRETSKLLVLR